MKLVRNHKLYEDFFDEINSEEIVQDDEIMSNEPDYDVRFTSVMRFVLPDFISPDEILFSYRKFNKILKQEIKRFAELEVASYIKYTFLGCKEGSPDEKGSEKLPEGSFIQYDLYKQESDNTVFQMV